MLSYHNDPDLKLKYQARFEAHRKADEVIQGQGFENGRGCFVGCTLNNYSHSQFEKELGWPKWLARLADYIFENIPKEEAPQFGTDLLEAVPVGVDLNPVKWKLAILRHQKQLESVKDNKEEYAEELRTALQLVISYCEAQLAGTATEEQRKTAARSASSAYSSAYSAAESAAESAYSAAQSSWSAAESAYSAAQSSWSAAHSAYYAAGAVESGRVQHWKWERDTLLQIVRELA